MRQDLMLRAHKASRWMEPIALLDDYVHIYTYKSNFYRQVIYWESIPPFQCIDTQQPPAIAVAAALAAQTLGPTVNVNNLEVYDEEFAQWRWFPLDNAMIRLFNPAGVSMYQLRNLQVGVDRGIIYRDPTLVSTEIHVWEDERPAVQPMNFSDYALTAVRIIAMGYRFAVQDVDANTLAGLKAGRIPCTPIICAGRSGT